MTLFLVITSVNAAVAGYGVAHKHYGLATFNALVVLMDCAMLIAAAAA